MKRISTLLLGLSLSLSAHAVDPTPVPKTPDKDVIGAIQGWAPKNDLKISLPVTKFTLENGLTVLLLEDHAVPMVSYHTWYRVGSRDESPGVTGAAHMLEHMMFKGAKKYDGKSFDRIFHENGITNNAFTTNDYTGFYENLPSSKLELVMDMEVDRMSSLLISPEDLKSEKEVVKEERRWRVDNNPMGLLRELMMGTIFKVHPYKWPVIGHMKDIEAYDSEKLRYFYNTFYVPNNAVLVVVGDFNTSKVKSLIEKYYGKLPSRPLPERKYPSEPAQKVQQNATLRKDVQNTSFVVAYKSPKQGQPDMYALDLAANILGYGTSSRLHKRLVYQKQTATSAYSYNYAMQDEGMFAVGVNLKPGQAPQEALDVVYNEIWKLRNQKVTEAELEKAKTQVMKDLVDSLKTMDGKARALAVNEIVTGSYQSLFTDLEKYQAVTADDIKRVADKYTQQTQRSIITLEPKVKKEQ
ncbi:pitrilysin family protein [Bdellovibrio bacteriovorus]|uniref:Protease n=1 Tax=Bdellovibrio bacteriovorus (strain ATCC 15356 / DSM 50701 / NCIMB 9529 / HD100) TaxID=264462 RepID=Q6MNZ5_BDEBA|nr:pitrilysin family protein [Bdellovibrio bacteriovorus]AHZ86319.1 protease [Bdellovibrio bacteriovorus]BEV67557.1 putative zinc protease [Bdellovibrio bacteriovorus]CAE79004.1 Protease [Bdellovibrio bacteriovorus HD100]